MIIETKAPIAIDDLKKHFTDENVEFLIDYDKSDLKGEKLLTYLSNLDLPNGDSSFLNVENLMKEVSKEFRVCISGDGGDELFNGYSSQHLLSYFFPVTNFKSLWKTLFYLNTSYFSRKSYIYVYFKNLKWENILYFF